MNDKPTKEPRNSQHERSQHFTGESESIRHNESVPESDNAH